MIDTTGGGAVKRTPLLNLGRKKLGMKRQSDLYSDAQPEESKGRVGTAGSNREQMLECPFRECGRKFVSEPELKNHMQRRHKPAPVLTEEPEKKASVAETTSSSR